MSEAGPAHSAHGAERPVDVSVLVPVLNEERHIRETVAAMQAQRFDGSIELLFADGGSSDRTREILEEIAASDPRIRVLENPRRRTASGLNVGLREARGEFVARMDAHTYYVPEYLATGVERLRRGGTEWVSGPAVPRPVGGVSRAVALALASPLGRGGSRKWSENATPADERERDTPADERERDMPADERELDTGVFGGVWRRSSLLAAGGWDERWPINQDSELAARFLDGGARLVCVAEMAGHYVPRDSIGSLARQYFRYGFYRARTFRRHPRSMRVSHLLAPGLALALACAVIGPRRLRTAARAGLGVYLAAVARSAADADDAQPSDRALLVAVLPVMHLGWGFGTLAGVARFGPPIDAIRHSFASDRGPASSDPEPVYAPSLHDAKR